LTAPISSYPEPRAPERFRTVNASGIKLKVYEWGDLARPPILLAHGGFDFARTFDAFAPLLAHAGFRVVAWDQRGHGRSDHAALYSQQGDLRDALAVMDSVTQDPVIVIGHSKGGSIVVNLAASVPHRVSSVTSIDGVPTRRPQFGIERRDSPAALLAAGEAWLDSRLKSTTGSRATGSVEDLAMRRSKMNPRLDITWLRYLVTVGAVPVNEGWRWPVDPALAFETMGPWTAWESLERTREIAVPILLVLGTEHEGESRAMSADELVGYLPSHARIAEISGAGHFCHIEQPSLVAAHILRHLGR